jgi:Peptidase A4 family
MKRLLSLAAAGLMCGATVVGASGVAGASSVASHGAPMHAGRLQPGGLISRVSGYGSTSPTVSENWSGYAVQSKQKFNSVHATFVQPSVKCVGKPRQITSNWVGLDGFSNQTVEQDGTFARCGGPANLTPEYSAWYEMFPAGSVNVFRVQPGDIIDASVTYGSGTFTLTISDLTSGKTHTQTATCASCQRASAEWIIERPAFCANRACTKAILGALADYGTTTMSAATASVDGGPVMKLSQMRNIPIFMVQPLNKGFISLDTVSPVSGPSFTATFDRSGTPIPISLSPRR